MSTKQIALYASALGVLGALATGCTVRARTAEPVAYTEVSSAPVDVYTYPHTTYDGRVVYLVDNRWYYQEGPRWRYYRSEPPPLVRYRTQVQAAPPAYRGGQPNYAPPPSRGPSAAPPATRVR